MTWFKVQHPLSSSIVEEFAMVFALEGAPKDALLFGGSEDGVHFYYFSPLAGQIFKAMIERLGGVSCGAPPPTVAFVGGQNPELR